MNPRRIRIVGAIAALILILDCIVLAGWKDSDREGSSWAARNRVPSELTGVPELERFVEQTRGLRFKQPVAIELVDQHELTSARHREAQLGEVAGGLVPTTESDGGAVLGVMGLLPPDLDVDVDAAVGDAEDQGVVGVYFPRQKRLLVAGTKQTPFVREVLVHELTHALDDQYFDLGRADIGLHLDEAAESWIALAEGDATWVEKQYVASLSAADQQTAAQERGAIAAGGGGAPSAIDDLLAYPYIAGYSFVDALHTHAGNGAVNAAFRHPPTTSEQLLRPDHYLAHDTPAMVQKPTPRGPAVGRGVFGVLHLGLLLSGALDGPAIRDALDGWDGDRFVAWSESGRTCLAVNVANESPAAAAKLSSALHTWLDHNPTGTVAVQGDVVELERCA
jgi:hypothetical protein